MKSALVICSRFVSNDLIANLKHLPISFFDTLDTAQTSEDRTNCELSTQTGLVHKGGNQSLEYI